ncbi:hypothetical protein EAE90_12955 [Photorhabdus caribbeanensis]|nr:hypothetical protein [Photorhabdus caribbeanensis]
MKYNFKSAIYNILSLLATIIVTYLSSVSFINNNNIADIILAVMSFFGFRSILKFLFTIK